MTQKELILKAKEAKSAEELLALAKENGMDLTEEQAKAYFEQLCKGGELADDELGNVAGGGCADYTTVTCTTECFKEDYFYQQARHDLKNGSLRRTWIDWAFMLTDKSRVCGKCVNLGFHNGIGYCKCEHS